VGIRVPSSYLTLASFIKPVCLSTTFIILARDTCLPSGFDAHALSCLFPSTHTSLPHVST
jgi:hypothetical protein